MITDIVMMISISLFTSFSISLNKYANDKNNNVAKIAVVYVSEALISSIVGFLLGLASSVFNNNKVVWVIFSSFGSFGGRGTLNILSKILFKVIINLKNIDIDDIKDDLDYNKKNKG